jgi:hypothetical protein
MGRHCVEQGTEDIASRPPFPCIGVIDIDPEVPFEGKECVHLVAIATEANSLKPLLLTK